MLILLALTGLFVMWFIYRRFTPLKNLTYVDEKALNEKGIIPDSSKILDVRDSTEYEKCHVDGSINISIGRLPYLWNKELAPNDSVLILSDSFYKSKKAAKILKKHGFSQLFTVRNQQCA
ncbi:hypothetical protein BK120_03035 [Paenibacillus sp. FSL A5-0031]|uniref:rhodanese-like domain-containing protein n=1 Tax=Paenibacillus sp. FSL A5-0031 TaxID=1920420 RepID=UPI0009701BE9|nr:rhodanese-like domain-containing protein [Paenibacillus sp. FSL A5-0031]OME88289.1 hypothetical protein BK120_03035 [Paenibacillus sp. FSL A5-0031]